MCRSRSARCIRVQVLLLVAFSLSLQVPFGHSEGACQPPHEWGAHQGVRTRRFGVHARMPTRRTYLCRRTPWLRCRCPCRTLFRSVEDSARGPVGRRIGQSTKSHGALDGRPVRRHACAGQHTLTGGRALRAPRPRRAICQKGIRRRVARQDSRSVRAPLRTRENLSAVASS